MTGASDEMTRLEGLSLAELIADSMALVKRVAAGLAASPTGYQPPEQEEEAAP